MSKAFLVLALTFLVARSQAGPIGFILSYGACQSACNAGYVACCAATGATAGTFTLGAGIPAALAACSVAQGACMALCAGATAAAPTP
nr:unnamed protein product [Callosobruchus chinensis]